jgi:hypothetical protein
MAMIGLQYSLIHLAINRGEVTFARLHAVGGVLLFGFPVFVFQKCRHLAADWIRWTALEIGRSFRY